jgi:hypothetical protein
MKKKKQAKREVLMKCQCGWEETPSSEGQVPLRCMQCRKGPIANAPYGVGKYIRSVETLIEAVKTETGVEGLLKEAVVLAEKAQSPFTISIRDRQEE